MFGGWMYWDATQNRWVPTQRPDSSATVTWYFAFASNPVPEPTPESPKQPWADLSATPDPTGIVCRPCSENAHAECEGAKVCGCPLCVIAETAREMTADWEWRDREAGWR